MNAPTALEDIRSPWFDRLARIGLVARGVVYVLLGVLAVKLASGKHDQPADQRGALRTLAGQPFGKWLLALLAAGLVSYALACALGAIRGRGGKKAGESDTKDRLADAGRAVFNGALAASAIGLLLGSSSGGGGNRKQKDLTAKMLDKPFGVVVVVAVALAVTGFGLRQIWKGYKRKFMKGLDTGRLPADSARRIELLGVVGYVARGVVLTAAGVFLFQAAVTYDPDKAVGIDGALSRLARSGPGPLLLIALALGLAAFGLWSMVEARLRPSSG